jgi:hypothetical protein
MEMPIPALPLGRRGFYSLKWAAELFRGFQNRRRDGARNLI